MLVHNEQQRKKYISITTLYLGILNARSSLRSNLLNFNEIEHSLYYMHSDLSNFLQKNHVR